jgi:hypothetical protein
MRLWAYPGRKAAHTQKFCLIFPSFSIAKKPDMEYNAFSNNKAMLTQQIRKSAEHKAGCAHPIDGSEISVARKEYHYE